MDHIEQTSVCHVHTCVRCTLIHAPHSYVYIHVSSLSLSTGPGGFILPRVDDEDFIVWMRKWWYISIYSCTCICTCTCMFNPPCTESTAAMRYDAMRTHSGAHLWHTPSVYDLIFQVLLVFLHSKNYIVSYIVIFNRVIRFKLRWGGGRSLSRAEQANIYTHARTHRRTHTRIRTTLWKFERSYFALTHHVSALWLTVFHFHAFYVCCVCYVFCRSPLSSQFVISQVKNMLFSPPHPGLVVKMIF